MDITSLFVDLLKKHNVTSVGGPRRQQTDEFLKEAERINSHILYLRRYLRSIRQPYLSTTQPVRRTDRQYFTETQRDQIDAESKQLLRDMNMAIQNLANAEQLRQKAEESLAQRRYGSGFGVLRTWAAGGSAEKAEDAGAKILKLHRESVLWYLRRQLESCSELQMTMMESRLVREMEKGKSRLYSARGTAAQLDHLPTSGRADAPSSTSNTEQADLPVTSEQLQLFAEENQSMLKHYEDTLDQVRTAERSLIEISELQTTLANNLAVQSAHIDQLVADTEDTSENVGGGNKQLQKAAERKSTAKYVFYGSCAFSLFLIIYDLLI